MNLCFFSAPLLTYSATPLTHPAKAAAPHDGFDHAVIPNDDDVLITYRGQGCPMGQRLP